MVEEFLLDDLMEESDREFLINKTQMDIECETAILESTFRNRCFEIGQVEAKFGFDGVYTESDDEQKSGGGLFAGIKKVIDSIIGFISKTVSNITEKIKSVFGGKEKLTADDFANSDTYNVMLNMDYQKKMQEIDNKMDEGSALIKKACSATGISEQEAQGYINGAQKIINNTPNLVCKAVKGVAAAGGMIILAKNFGKVTGWITGKLNGHIDNLRREREEIERLEKKDKRDARNAKTMETIRGIFSVRKNLMSIYNGISSKSAMAIAAAASGTTAGNSDKKNRKTGKSMFKTGKKAGEKTSMKERMSGDYGAHSFGL